MDPEIFDRHVLDVVRRLLPAERVSAYLHVLDRQFAQLADAASTDSILQSNAHKIVSQAGMLGLTRMATRAAQVENALRCGTGSAAAILECRDAIADVRLYALPATASG